MSVIPTPETAQPGDTIRAKWMLDGATSLAEAAEMATEAAERLQALHDAGWTLSNPVDDDYGFLIDPSGDSGGLDPDE